MVQASAQAYLAFGKEEKVRAKARARADILFARHICHWRIVDGDGKNCQRKLNVVLVVERDIRHMIANVQRRHAAVGPQW